MSAEITTDEEKLNFSEMCNHTTFNPQDANKHKKAHSYPFAWTIHHSAAVMADRKTIYVINCLQKNSMVSTEIYFWKYVFYLKTSFILKLWW